MSPALGGLVPVGCVHRLSPVDESIARQVNGRIVVDTNALGGRDGPADDLDLVEAVGRRLANVVGFDVALGDVTIFVGGDDPEDIESKYRRILEDLPLELQPLRRS